MLVSSGKPSTAKAVCDPGRLVRLRQAQAIADGGHPARLWLASTFQFQHGHHRTRFGLTENNRGSWWRLMVLSLRVRLCGVASDLSVMKLAMAHGAGDWQLACSRSPEAPSYRGVPRGIPWHIVKN